MNLPISSDTCFHPWYVLGAGAMGCLWAIHLTQHLQRRQCAVLAAKPLAEQVAEQQRLPSQSAVCLLLRDQHALQRYPGAVTLEHGQQQNAALTTRITLPARALDTATPATLKIHRLLLSCKAHDAAAAINSVSPFLADNAIVVLLQNGIRFQQQLSDCRPPGTVFCLSTSFGAWLRKPFHSVAAGAGQTWLGHLYQHPAPSLQQSLQQTLQQLLSELPQQAMNISLDHNMSQRLWEKLAINCAINGLTVIYDCHNGELLTRADARQHCQALCEEISHLLQQIPQAPAMPELWQRVQQVATGTANNISSTLQDIRHQRPTEITQLNGYLCDLAAQHHLPCPLNQQVLEAVLESSRLSQISRSSQA